MSDNLPVSNEVIYLPTASGQSTELLPAKRKRGAQPGNHNGLKHGLYIEGHSVRNTTPIERAQLNDLGGIIDHFKDYMDTLYEEGQKSKTLAEFNETMHNMSLAAMALTRLLYVHNQFQNSSLPADFSVKPKTTLVDLVEYYKKKMSPIIDLTGFDPNQHT
jgi:hypothetical protein